MKDDEILDSWKEIASFLNRGVRTVQRWEKTERLPVRRHQHLKRGSAYAVRSELDAWQRMRERRAGFAESLVDERPFQRLRALTAQQAALRDQVKSLLAQSVAFRASLGQPKRLRAVVTSVPDRTNE